MKEIVVLLATYNGQEYLREQLDSLVQQTFKDFKIIVHDDGSTDGTIEIIDEYQKKYPEMMVQYFGEPLGSAKANFLWMLKQVQADYYFFCDQDDVWAPDKVERSLQEMYRLEEQNREAQLLEAPPTCIFTDMRVVDKNLDEISPSFIRYIGRSPENIAYTQILIDNPAAGCTMCINRQLKNLVVDMLPFIELDLIPMHDALVLEVAAIMGHIHCIDEPMVSYRQTGHNTMGAVTETDSDKANRNITDLKEGNFFEKKKAFVYESRLFAAEVAKAGWMPVDKKNVLIRFANIGQKPKFKRMSFYSKYNFTRAHHNFWFRLWV